MAGQTMGGDQKLTSTGVEFMEVFDAQYISETVTNIRQ